MKKSKFSSSLRDSLRNIFRIPLLSFEWWREKKNIARCSNIEKNIKPTTSILIISPDPRLVIGSKGDEAMIFAVVEFLRLKNPAQRIGILTTGAIDAPDFLALNIIQEPVWSNPWSLKILRKTIEKYTTVVVIGADVMDGFYSAVSAARLWVVADLGARLGKDSAVLGFSFNESPSFWLEPFVKGIDRRTHIFLRDAVSLGRFRSFSDNQGELVADLAFLLTPRTDSAVIKRIKSWSESRRVVGRTIVAFNIHPMLFKSGDVETFNQAIAASVKMVEEVVRNHGVSVVLVSHDYRAGGLGESFMLKSVSEAVSKDIQSDVLYFDEHLHAADLKGVAGLADAVVTGRMHFAIAALGQGVPVAAITYQGKFDGLFKHFDLPNGLLITPEAVTDSDALLQVTLRLLAARMALREQVVARLPEVHKLAEKNLTAIGLAAAQP